MEHPLKIKLGDFREYDRYKEAAFWIDIGESPDFKPENMHFHFMNDLGTLDQVERLSTFLDQATRGTLERDEFWTNGFTAKVVEKDGKKMIKSFFRLTDDYAIGYIPLHEFKEIVEAYIKEMKEFKKDPEAYKEKLKREGGLAEEVEEESEKETQKENEEKKEKPWWKIF